MADCFLDAIESLRRTQAVRTDVARLTRNLLLDPRDANLKKLIQVRTENRKKFDPLDERLTPVLRFLEDAAVELEPA